MGGGTFSAGSYRDAAATRAASGVDDFDYSHKVRTGKASGIHATLDPKWVAGAGSPLAGQNVRESRDSDEHPDTLPVAVFFDVTGSMGGIPRILQQKLPDLLDVIIAKANVAHPNILVGAIGDSFSDSYPFQVGQFESDNRFDEQLRAIILEGGGGGQVMESYALAWYFAAKHTATDAFEKRGKKGYLITMGDEAPHPKVLADEVRKIFGVGAEADMTAEELVALASERWEIFHLFCLDGSYPNRDDIKQRWRDLLGERVIMVEDSSLVCEIVAGLVHMLENAFDVDKVLGDIGISGPAADKVRNALVPVGTGAVSKHVATGGLPGSRGGGADTVTRV